MAKIKKAQPGKSVSKKEAPKMNFKSSENWADNYSLDTTGLSKGSSNYYPYRRSNGTRGVVTRSEAKSLVDDVKSGKLKKSDWKFKAGGKATKAKDGKWIQKATASIKRRGTEGKCTPITKPGCTGRAKALAKTFKKMAKARKKK